MRTLSGTVLIAAGVLLGDSRSAGAQERFECLAWVDHFDFAAVKVDGRYAFDAETPQGCETILDHVLETGATTILWRNCGGATMRYQSRVESHHQDAPVDKRRLPDNRDVHGWLRFGDAEPDIVRHVLAVCRDRGLGAGVHWPFEENHWSSWTLGGWNLDRPHYWCRTADGHLWAGRASLAYPDVMAHKLDLLDELIARGMETLFVDTWRSGGWSPADEFVPPMIEAWEREHPGVPLPSDPRDERWCRHVAATVTTLFGAMRQRLDGSGRRIRFLLGVFGATADGAQPLRERGVDWRRLVDEGIIDGLVINSVPWDAKRPMESTREHYRGIIAAVGGRCDVYCPVRAYDYNGFGMPSYAKSTGLKQPEIAEALTRMAWEEGASGISLECVDCNNYVPSTRRTIRELLAGPCRHRREPEQPPVR